MKNIILFIIIALTLLMPSEVCAERQRSFIKKLEPGMTFCWKKKKGKYALVRKLKGYDDYYVTDYIYDVSKRGKNEDLLVFSGVNFEHQWIVVERDNKFGIINLHGEEVVPCLYDEMNRGAKIDGKWYFTKEYHFDDKDSYVGRSDIKNNDIVIAKNQNGKKGIIEFNWVAKTILDFEYDYIYIPDNNCRVNFADVWTGKYFHENYYCYNVPMNVGLKYSDAQYFIIGKGDKYGLYDRIENKIIEPIYNQNSFELGYYKEKTKQSGYYHHLYNGLYLKTSDEYFNAVRSDDVTLFFGETILLKKDGKRVLYDMSNGCEIILENVKSESILRTKRNLYYQYNNGIANGFVIDNGYEIEAKYDGDNIENFEPMPSDSTEIFKVKNRRNKNTLYGLYNAKLKKEILSPVYTKILKTNLNDGFFLVEKDSTESYYAYITNNKDSVILLKNKKDAYKDAKLTSIDKTLSIAEKDGVYGLTDKESGLVVPCIYDSIKPLKSLVEKVDDSFNNLFVSYYHGRIGMISPEATITLPYFTDIEYKADTITLWTKEIPSVKGVDVHDVYKIKFKMDISINGEDLISSYNWDRFLDIYLFEHSYNLAVYTDYQPFLKAIVYATLHEKEAKLSDEISNGHYISWCNGIDEELTSFAQMAYYHLDMKDELYDYLKSSFGTIANLKKDAERMEALKQQQYEEERRQQRIAAEQARLERQRQWENLAIALGNLADNVNAAVNSGKSRKRAKTYTYNNNNVRRSSANNHSHSSTSSGSSVVRCDECGGDGKCTKVTSNLTLFKTYCKGTGKCHNCIDGLVKDAFGTRLCSYCNGSGKCYHCKGTGKCTKCHGTGKIVKKK